MASLLRVEEPPRAPEQRFALFALGFRPFYLLASTFAALSIPLWALQFSGVLTRPYLSGPLWHATASAGADLQLDTQVASDLDPFRSGCRSIRPLSAMR